MQSWVKIGPVPSFEQEWVLFTQGCIVQSLDEIGLVIFGEEYENVKSLLTDRRTVDRVKTVDSRSEKLLERSAQVS